MSQRLPENMQFAIRVNAKVHAGVSKRAAAMGMTATGFAKLLFEAGFAARVGQERDVPAVDGELDEQVRLIFACAGQANTAAIAKATGLPEPRVVRILEAWKKAGKKKGGGMMRRVILALAMLCGATGIAAAHDAPTGWSYPFACCSNFDCRQVDAAAIAERPEGYVIKRTGEAVSYGDVRLKDSPDGEFHWCSVAGAPDSRTICLFVPPRGY